MGKEGKRRTTSEEYVKKAEELLAPIMEKNQYDLVDVEYVKEGGEWRLRIYMDKEGGVTIGDCEKVNREFGEIMDANDFIPDSYILEVSSPGLGRRLKKDKDFQRNMGKDVEVKLYQPIDFEEGGKTIQTKELLGILEAADEEAVTLGFGNGKEVRFLKKDIAVIRLAIDF